MADPRTVVDAYFAALARRDAEAAAAEWAADGVDTLAGFGELRGPAGVRGFFAELFAAVPDWSFDVVRSVAEGDAVAVRWHATGTFTGAPFNGIEATGARIDVSGLDLLVVADGRIARNDAFMDSLGFARQIGLLPPAGSAAESRLNAAFNARTRLARRVAASDLEPVADGVWRLRGGFPLRLMNVYLLEEPGGGVTVFDAGVRQMANAIATGAASLGGLRRVVLGHSHPDHRGAAALLRAPVWCHRDERADAEGDGGRHYARLERLRAPAKWTLPRLLEVWDGGPVTVADTLAEGDEVAGFRVLHMPGHAPGQIALVRDSDRLALTSDVFYVVDIGTGRALDPIVPDSAFNHDSAQARASIARLAALDLAGAWPGHGEPLRGDVRGQLERVR